MTLKELGVWISATGVELFAFETHKNGMFFLNLFSGYVT